MALGITVLFLGYLLVEELQSRSDEAPGASTSVDQLEAGSSTSEGVATDAATGPSADGDTTTAGEGSVVDRPAPAGGYLDAQLNLDASPGRGLFTLSGRVPEGEEGDALLQKIQVVYSPFAEVDVTRDPSLAVEPWMDAAGKIIPLFGSLSGGFIRISNEGVVVEGEASAPEIEAFASGVALLAGELPVDTSGLLAVDLREPSYRSSVEDGIMTISGEVPTQFFADGILSAAVSTYGADGVIDELTVTPEVHAAFWMLSVPNGIRQLAGYPSYRFAIADGAVEADLQGDAGFEPDSAELNEESATVIGLWYGVMTQDPTSTLTVRGHTDSDGADAYNLQLSTARADAYVAALTELGIDPGRLVTEGVGEAEPIAPNDTPENKAKNRRVEFVFE
jgi:outer membrane protein OmpA-like peptidoglycan-associated protein